MNKKLPTQTQLNDVIGFQQSPQDQYVDNQTTSAGQAIIDSRLPFQKLQEQQLADQALLDVTLDVIPMGMITNGIRGLGRMNSAKRANLHNWSGGDEVVKVHRGDTVAHEAFDGNKNRNTVHNTSGTYVTTDKGIAEGYAKGKTWEEQTDDRGIVQDLIMRKGKTLNWDDPKKVGSANVSEARRFGRSEEQIAIDLKNKRANYSNGGGKDPGSITEDSIQYNYKDLVNGAPNKIWANRALRDSGFTGINFHGNKNYLVLDDNHLKSVKNNGQYSTTGNNIYKGLILPGAVGLGSYNESQPGL